MAAPAPDAGDGNAAVGIHCDWLRMHADPEARVADASDFARVTLSMQVPEIIALLGPAQRHIVTRQEVIAEWRSTNLETLAVIIGADCGNPSAMSWSHIPAAELEGVEAASPALAIGAATAPAHCEWPQPLIDARARVADASLFSQISPAMMMEEIVARLGPAAKDSGSDIHALIWQAEDGTQFRVSTSGPCGNFRSIGIESAQPMLSL
ncbi:MAG: hypothetical protein LBL59_02670 [Xanthomonadaceae bacterium]|nr:hypothetical protein [Xanthomonadaceae bacterium]